ncbi:MAG: hypothetical protein H6735_28110 [Alphaproteobacteria bacterium]|nr:hypothetical protein [Alphaproteobacteria bacterium]
MRRWMAVGALVGAIGCTPQEDATVADLESLRALHVHHREIVQASFDMSEIGGFEQEYAIDWEGLAQRVSESMAGCVPADSTEMSVIAWLDNLSDGIEGHVSEYELHTSFMDCWTSEDGHHNDVMEGLDAAEAAEESCR